MKAALLVYAGLAYATFIASLAVAMGFFADWGSPWTIDGQGATPAAAVAIDGGLLLAFALQHSVMARPAFKRRWRRVVPEPAERSTYVLAASGLLLVLFAQWRALPQPVWVLGWAPGVVLVECVYGLGWCLAVASTFMIDHLEMFGLRRAYLFAVARAEGAPGFKERWLYAWVRHPMMLGLLVVFWATPTMSAGHLLFALAGTGYIFAGTWLEERDLRTTLGAAYREYATRVPAFIPLPRVRRLPVR